VKYITLGVSTLLMLGGCVGQPKPLPAPAPVVKKVKKPKPVAKPRHIKKGKVPPLPEREVDIDVDRMVDQAMGETLNDDNAVQEMP